MINLNNEMRNKKNKSLRVINASQKSTIVEHRVNNLDCVSNYRMKVFKII